MSAAGASRKVVFCTPTVTRPFPGYLDSLEASVPLIKAAGWDEGSIFEIGNPYISVARANLLRKALDAKADVIVFLDHDLSWEPRDLVRLIEHPGDVVGGTYRFKKDDVEYMGRGFAGLEAMVQGDPAPISAECLPAGFLKVTAAAVAHFMQSYPDLVYGPIYAPSVDLFNHGAHKGTWWGEDYAFCRNWRDAGGEVMLIPDLSITHHTTEKAFAGNFFEFMREGVR